MQITQGKVFEKAAPGMYLGTVIDVVEMPNVPTQYGLKNKVRIHWLLANLNGQLVLGKDGLPIEATGFYNATSGPKSELTKRVAQILYPNASPLVTETQQLAELIIGRSNILVLVQGENPKNPQDPYINVDGIGPIQSGMPSPPAIPANYIRHINRPKTQVGPNGQPVQTYATPAAAQAAIPTYPVAPGYAPNPGYAVAPPPTGAPAPAAPVQTVNLNAGTPAPAVAPGTTRQPF